MSDVHEGVYMLIDFQQGYLGEAQQNLIDLWYIIMGILLIQYYKVS